MPRKNKTKKEVVKDIKDLQETERKRKLIKETIFPFLIKLNETIAYTKVFLQGSAMALERTFNDKQKEIKVEEFLPKLRETFKGDKQSELDLYIQFFELLKNESISDFTSLIEEIPRVVENYFTRQNDKRSVKDIPIEEILG